MPSNLSGACLCGAVKYAVLDEFEYAANCHCSLCRRATGSAFKPFAGIPRGKLELVSGSDAVLIHGEGADAHDVRCGRCGSLIYSVVRDGMYVHVTMGTLIDEPTIKPSMHIFVGSKAKWHQINDDLPQHSKLPS
jgi:hypothetical protein